MAIKYPHGFHEDASGRKWPLEYTGQKIRNGRRPHQYASEMWAQLSPAAKARIFEEEKKNPTPVPHPATAAEADNWDREYERLWKDIDAGVERCNETWGAEADADDESAPCATAVSANSGPDLPPARGASTRRQKIQAQKR